VVQQLEGFVRIGVQSFGGQLLRLTPFQSFTQPNIRLDLDRMDDNDDRLFGVTASYQLTLRAPLYAVRHWSVKKSLTRRANHLDIFILARILEPAAGENGRGLFQSDGGQHTGRTISLTS
jgi:hypothetical protein